MYSKPAFPVLFGFRPGEDAQGLHAQQLFWMEFLFYFPSLQTLTLSFWRWKDYQSIMEPITMFLEANKEKFVSGKAPKVVFLDRPKD
jgi:hypothetical protein